VPAPLALCYLNGEGRPPPAARISPLDRGFLFGDAVYEVMPVFDSRAYRFDAHIDRLERSLSALRIASPADRAGWRRICGGLVHRNGGGDLSLYLQVSRGTEFGRNHVPPPELEPTVFGFATPLPPRAATDPGIACITAEDIRWHLCDIKSTTLLANVLLRWRAVERDAVEAILLRNGEVREGSYSSVHVVTDGVLLSPPLDHEVLPGTTRGVLLELAARAGVPTAVRRIGIEELRRAEEVIVGAASLLVRPVTRIDGEAVGTGVPGPVFQRLRRLFEATLHEMSSELPG
jgi:D-alanine transaminase